jgi:hypothetical protein
LKDQLDNLNVKDLELQVKELSAKIDKGIQALRGEKGDTG